MPGGDIVLDQGLQIRVRINKAALAIQNRASIEITNLNTQLREQLLSQFTAWNKRQVETGQLSQNWIDVKIEAGYVEPQGEISSVVFLGQVALVDPASPPPNIGVRLTCYSRQIDKTSFITDRAPTKTTFAGYVKWAAEQMGFGSSYICDTSYNDVEILNPARSIFTVAGLLPDIQSYYRPDVAAFVDDNVLIVKDRSKVVNPDDVTFINRFVGIPSWTEWGCEFNAMFDPSVRLAQAVYLRSLMNPGLNGTYVLMELEYDLSSRDNPFYMKGGGSPPA
jgi:hypothetical protein